VESGCCCAVTSGHGYGNRESGESRAAAQTIAQCFRRGAWGQEIRYADYVAIDIALIEQVFPEADDIGHVVLPLAIIVVVVLVAWRTIIRIVRLGVMRASRTRV